MLVCCAAVLHCGGLTHESTGGGDGGAEANADGSASDSLDSGPDACLSASGYAICGGPNDCFPPDAQSSDSSCWGCVAGFGQAQPALCVNAAQTGGSYSNASDGEVYVEGTGPGAWNNVPFDVGVLFAANGAADRVRYADWAAWTGAALPEPTSCPPFQGFAICGGNCDPCGINQVCTGRSPAHPYGICITPYNRCYLSHPNPCASGEGCLVFTEATAADQAVADEGGLCFSLTECQAIASQLPGGATCHPSP